jgi:hypothetical protein
MRLRYDPVQQQALFDTLMIETQPTDEQLPFIIRVCKAIRNEESLIILLQGEGGSGKSTMAKIIIAFARSLQKIVLGCASTALAASIYENFYTAHSLFKIPVVDEKEEDLNQENDLKCDLDKHRNRKELLDATSVIIWDEISSQHIRDFSAVYHAMNGFKNKVVILMGDKMQITPVVKHGKRDQIISSSIYCSKYMKNFEKHFFTQNLRLIGSDDEDQKLYARTLLEIGKGTYFQNDINYQNDNEVCPITILQNTEQNPLIEKQIPKEPKGTTTIAFQTIAYDTDMQTMIDWLHPNGFDLSTMTSNCILAVTNKQVDTWNTNIQSLNHQTMRTLVSNDSFNEIDDPNDFIKGMITEEVMNAYTENSAPPHILYLKVDDICILLRNVDINKGLTSNTRVRILNITANRIQVCTLDRENPVYANLCRFKFGLTLPFGKSLVMQRSQFPLRLAYALSFNKAQGQQFHRLALDITIASFSHGHLYVALSRIRFAMNIKFFVTNENLTEDGKPFTKNVVYDEIINCFNV